MRLICPNCDANYEVDAGVIPEAGRDVQCSNCGHTWFQSAEDITAGILASAAEQASVAEEEPEAVYEEELPAGDVEDDESYEAYAEPDDDFEPSPELADTRRQELDDAVLGILREEAAHEERVRETEGTGLETQPGLGIDDGSGQSGARSGQDDDTESGSHRRDLLPDIEEINSTLRAAGDREDENLPDEESDEHAPRKSSFRRGFLLVMVLFAIGLVLYAWAPVISQKLPAAEPYLNTWVDIVNDLRVWLDGVMASGVEAMSGLTGG